MSSQEDVQTTEEVDLERIIKRLQALIHAAEHDTDPTERQARLDMANKIAHKHRIDLSLIGSKKAKKREPIWNIFDVDYGKDFSGQRTDMRLAVFRLYGLQGTRQGRHIHAVGYEEDFLMALMMYTCIELHFIQTVAPNWDLHHPFEWNVFEIKNSGRSWAEIVIMAPLDFGLTMQSGSRLRNAYAKEAKKRGVTDTKPQPNQPKKWRESFAESYSSTMVRRLSDMEIQMRKEDDSQGGQGVIALRNDEELIKEELYTRFPSMRPWSKEAHEEHRAKRQKERDDALAAYMAMTPAQQAAHDRKQEREKAKSDKYWERYDARHQPDMEGWVAGQNAALRADLGTDGRVEDSQRPALS